MFKMMFQKKRYVLYLAALFFLLCSAIRAEAAPPPAAKHRIVVEGNVIDRIKDPVIVNNQPLVPLRVVAESLGAFVSWDSHNQMAIVRHNGHTAFVRGTLLGNRLMVDPNTITDFLRVNVGYHRNLNTTVFTRGAIPTQDELLTVLPQFSDYSYEDVHWLSRIVEAEARGETFESRLAVANVVLNRKNSTLFPSSVREVIFDRQHGIQFTPTANGSVHNNPSPLSFLAALDALDGHNNAPGALFFLAPRFATNFWIPNNRVYAFTIGGHAYYY
jgi:N-acetylmuramoyl-L-alanine amidase